MKKVLLLGVCSLFVFNNAYACKFKELLVEDKQFMMQKVILQYDDDEGRREAGATIEINKIDDVIRELNTSIKTNLKKGYKIIGVDFSNTDLINEELGKIVELLLSTLKTIEYLDLSDTHTDAREIDKYTKNIPSLLGRPNQRIDQLAEQDIFYMPLAEYYGK
jgi:hypothetical protein